MATTDDDTKQEPEKRRQSLPSAFAVLGWIMGGFSLMTLIEGANLVKLRGLIEEWVDAYGFLVETVANALNDLIGIDWLKLDEIERHLVVILWVVMAALYRAGGWRDRIVAVTLSVLVLVLQLLSPDTDELFT